MRSRQWRKGFSLRARCCAVFYREAVALHSPGSRSAPWAVEFNAFGVESWTNPERFIGARIRCPRRFIMSNASLADRIANALGVIMRASLLTVLLVSLFAGIPASVDAADAPFTPPPISVPEGFTIEVPHRLSHPRKSKRPTRISGRSSPPWRRFSPAATQSAAPPCSPAPRLPVPPVTVSVGKAVRWDRTFRRSARFARVAIC